MSNRYSIGASASQIEARFSIEVLPGYAPNYNASPGQLLPVITNTGPEGLSFFYWGLEPRWANNKPISEKVVNVKSELIDEKASYRKTLAQRRCIIPADGFYEWKKIGKKTSVPYRFRLQDQGLFAFAALWDEYDDDNESFHTFTMITVLAPPAMLSFNDRFPLILSKENEKIWLSGTATTDELLSMIKDAVVPVLDHYSISPRINSVTANDSTLLQPTPPTDQFGNLTLFD